MKIWLADELRHWYLADQWAGGTQGLKVGCSVRGGAQPCVREELPYEQTHSR